MSVLWTVLGFIATVLSMILFHELGHYLAAKELGVKSRIRWQGLVTETTITSPGNLLKILYTGIIAGVLPIFAYILSGGLIGLLLGAILLYYYLFIGCSDDFRKISEIKKRGKE